MSLSGAIRHQAGGPDPSEDRALRGANDWTPSMIVLDVAAEATRLNFGALLAGRGMVDIADLHLDEVDESVPTTLDVLPDEPRNLDFGGLAADRHHQSGARL